MGVDRRHLESIAALVDQGKAIVFVGEGVSIGARLKSPTIIGGEEIREAIPLDTLARLLCQELSLPIVPLGEAAERFERRRGRVALNEVLWQLYRDLEPGPLHRLIVRLGFKLIYTTNYDSLLEAAFRRETGLHPIVVARNTDVALVKDRRTIVKLHGDIGQPDTILITETDYADYPRGREALFNILRADLYSHSFVFLGYSLRDNSLRNLYRSMVATLGRFVNLSYAVLNPEEVDSESESIWRDNYRIQLLASPLSEFLEALEPTIKRVSYKSELKERKRRIESAREHFKAQADDYRHAILVYIGTAADLDAMQADLREEDLSKGGPFAHVDLKATGPFKGRAGLFKYILGQLTVELNESVKATCGQISPFEPDFSEYERRAQSEEYRYLFLRYRERADRMMQGSEPIPNRAAVQEIWEETFVNEAMQDFVTFLQHVADRCGSKRIVLFFDRLDMVDQFLPALQTHLFERVIAANKNALFVITYASSEPPKWEGYAFEDRHVEYHWLSPAHLVPAE